MIIIYLFIYTMPIQQGIYYQPQNNNLCRLHSLNGFFAEEKISITDFNKYMTDYDNKYLEKYNFTTSCKLFDAIASDQKNITSYILKQYGIYTKYYSLNQLYGKSIHDNIIKILEGDYFFQYNEGHIWGVRRHNNKWYKVDSIGGVRCVNINSINQKNVGFIIPVNIKDEFYRNLQIIKLIFGDKPTEKHIRLYLEQKNKENLILGDLEIPLNLCMDILEMNLSKKHIFTNQDEFNPIQQLVDRYNNFLTQFTKGMYNNIQLILEYLVDIFYKLTLLKCK